MNAVIVRVAIPIRVYRYFDYLVPDCYKLDQLQKGMRLLVPFGQRKVIGFLVAAVATSDLSYAQLKPIITVLDNTVLLPANVLQLVEWASKYYHYPLGEVLATALPVLLRRLSKKQGPSYDVSQSLNLLPSTPIWTTADMISAPWPLNPAQQAALTAIEQCLDQFQVFLLHGVTGSGKTEVYLQVIAKVLQMRKQALVLVPEISLILQTVAHLQQRFTVPIITFHSGLSDRERLQHWLLARSGRAAIIVGTRSAVFVPLLAPGVIVVDEEHDGSFKQQEGLRYHARDLALVRARIENIPIILGSATISLESFYNAQQKRYHLLRLPNRVGQAVMPQFQLVDLRNQQLVAGLSPVLLHTMAQHLQAGNQVLLFLNRRGFAPVYRCHSCGWVAGCGRCDSKLVVHKRPPLLRCHYCDHSEELKTVCPQCNQPKLFTWGQGTQRLEQRLRRYFPAAGVVRIDRDNTRCKHGFADLLTTFYNSQILIGTQMLAKGHHFPDVTLVGIVDADIGLLSSDFRASEHSAQLLIQVAGRAGRVDKPGEVLVQTYYPQHPLLTQLIQGGYERFSQLALEERQIGVWPPYSYLALLQAEARIQTSTMNFLLAVKQLALSWQVEVLILGPVAALLVRRAGRYRAQLLFQANRRYTLQALLQLLVPQLDNLPAAHSVRWYLDIDPVTVN